jgi:hypothetical protein
MNHNFCLVKLRPDGSFPSFQETHFYLSWLRMQLVWPLQQDGHQQLLNLAYEIYCRCRLRWQVEEHANGDGGKAVPS